MKRNGIPEDQIIVMAYDDIANDPENPFPGKIFNKPNGQDVYEGCKIDYRANDVTPSNFLNILKGNAAGVTGGNGKVLKTNENSKVFVNFADHGAPGLIAFPSEYLYANDLNAAIKYMNENKMYKEMVMYIEACESGSMFDGLLPDNINVYAITAANPSESSWGTYCYPDDAINGVHIGSCLGDLFSVNWMEDAEATDPKTESLDTQFDKVLKMTDKSHVMRYGALNFKNEPVGNFYGSDDEPMLRTSEGFLTSFFDRAKLQYGLEHEAALKTKKHLTATNTRDSKLHHLWATVAEKRSHKAQLDLNFEVTKRMRVDHVFEAFSPMHLRASADEKILPRNFECLKTLISHYESQCEKLDDYSLQFVKYFVQVCEQSNELVSEAQKRLTHACSH